MTKEKIRNEVENLENEIKNYESELEELEIEHERFLEEQSYRIDDYNLNKSILRDSIDECKTMISDLISKDL